MAEPPPAFRTPVAGGRDLPPAPWVTLGQDNVADCRVFRVQRRRLRHVTDGRKGDFYIIEAPDWAQTLALTPRQELILVRQWRFGVEKLSWEPPGGIIEPGEDIHAGAPARLLGRAAPNPAIQNNYTHFILVENCAPQAPPDWDPHEELQVGIFPLDKVRQMIQRGEIFHSLALNALQFLFSHLAQSPPR